MKAIRYHKYGSTEVLQIENVGKPTPGSRQILIKTMAASVNPLDWHFMRGSPYFMRLLFGLFAPKSPGLGADIAGEVEAVGNEVSKFKPGDKVFGELSQLGSFAEYALASENEIYLKPANLLFEEAAAVPVAALTAWQGLRFGKVEKGQQVLINGASGGVGTFAVQIARALGAHVTGVCSSRNLAMVQALGADEVIDYTKNDFIKGDQYDLVFDAVGNRSVSELKHAVKSEGRVVVAGYMTMSLMLGHALGGLWFSKTSKRQIGLMPTAYVNGDDLAALKGLIESDKIKPVIDRTYRLEEVPKAVDYLEGRHARGKVAISV